MKDAKPRITYACVDLGFGLILLSILGTVAGAIGTGGWRIAMWILGGA